MPDDYDDRPRRRRDDDDEDEDRPRRRRDDDDDDYDSRPRDDYDRRAKDTSNGLATAGLILGFLALCTGPFAGIPALICSGLSFQKPGGRVAATFGLILGFIGCLGILLIFPAVEKTRLAASRMKEQNNLKQIALAFHNEESTYDAFSGPYMTTTKLDGTVEIHTGLSWRVGLLPFLEGDHLYRSFKTDEAWDSPANRTISDTPLMVYTSPYDGQKPSTETPYRVFYGGGALFNEDGKPVRLLGITDGTSNTIMAIQAWDQVPWAAPREFKYEPKGPLPKFGHLKQKGGFNVAMADGSVRFVSDTVPERTLRLLITKADGEVVDW